MKTSRRAHARGARKAMSYQTNEGAQEREADTIGEIVTAVNDRTAVASPAAYATAWEHLADELRRLDLLICCRLPDQPDGAPAAHLQQFKGLVLTEEEIRKLLGTPLGPSSYHADQDADDLPNQDLQAALRQVSSHIQARRTASFDIYLPLPYLAQLFHLTAFEEQCLVICLAPELDRKYEKLYSYLQDDVTRKKPSVDVVLNLLCQTMPEKLAARLAFDPQSPLLKYRLLQVTDNSPDGPSPLLSRFLKLDDRLVNFLLGFGQMDARLESFARLVFARAELDQVPVGEQIQRRIRSFVDWHYRQESRREQIVFHFGGPYGSGKRLLAEAICHELKLPLLIAEADKMPGGQVPFEEALWLLGREAVLQSAAVCIQDFDSLLADDKHAPLLKPLLEVTKTFALTVFLLGTRSWKPLGLLNDIAFIDLEIPIPDDGTRKRLWKSHLNGRSPLTTDAEAGALASKFRFTPGQIQDAVAAARNLARWRAPGVGPLTVEELMPRVARSPTRSSTGSRTKSAPSTLGTTLCYLLTRSPNSAKCASELLKVTACWASGVLAPSFPRAKESTPCSQVPVARARPWRPESSPTNWDSTSTRLISRKLSANTSGKPKRISIPFSQPPKTAILFSFSTRPMRCLANAPKSAIRTTAMPISRFLICSKKWKITKVLPSWPPICTKTWMKRSSGAWRFRSTSRSLTKPTVAVSGWASGPIEYLWQRTWISISLRDNSNSAAATSRTSPSPPHSSPPPTVAS